MKFSHFVGIWAVAALILFKAVKYALVRRRRSFKSQELGCKPVPAHTPGDPFGIYNLRLILNAGEKHHLPEYLLQRVHAVSTQEGRLVTTFQECVLGQKNIFTCEPKNIQALLATSFRDFELGKARNGNFKPMLGHGIVSIEPTTFE